MESENRLCYRHEIKYVLTPVEYRELVPRLSAVMKRDPHAGRSGLYRVSSIYFDNYRDKALHEKLDGVAVRQKFRIRWYNDDLTHFSLEKKVKMNSLCLKRGTQIDEEECRRILKNDIAWMADTDDVLLRELYVKEKTQQLRPRIKVSYSREPFVYSPGNVRVTIDSDIRTSMYHPFVAGFQSADINVLREPGHMILEVKYDAYLPEIIVMLLQTGNLRQSAFSKYGVSRCFG